MSDTSIPGRLPRRPALADDTRAATAEPVDLRDLAARSTAEHERPCPRCATPVATAPATAGVPSYACAVCGRRWTVGADGPWPDVVVIPGPADR